MRFHVLGICHTISNKEYLSCAFTQKVVKFCEMMTCLSETDVQLKKNMSDEEIIKHPTIHHLIHYGHNKSQTLADEQVDVMNDALLDKVYGKYDWKSEMFRFGYEDEIHLTFTANVKRELGKRVKNGDIILCFWGIGHRSLSEQFNGIALVVEPGIGYNPESCFAPYKVFESYACMHKYYGYSRIEHPTWYDCVIPNYFNSDDFYINENENNEICGYRHKTYYLYIGRIIKEKGLDVVLHLAKTKGFILLLVGQGKLSNIGYDEKTLPRNIKHIGFADLEKRKKLMHGAKGVFLPTMYIEPFGGTTVESMFCGTPVITTDWGVFNETVLHGITGYRCRTLEHFEYAIDNVEYLDSNAIKQWANDNYGYKKIRQMYEEYFDMLLKVKFDAGFMKQNTTKSELNWLERHYPTNVKNTHMPKEKLLCFTETKHAFGTICSALQKYSKKYDIDMIEWTNEIPANIFCKYNKIYSTTWDITKHILKTNIPALQNIKYYFSGHGKIDFLKQDYETLSNIPYGKHDAECMEIDSKLIAFFQTNNASVVSNELKNILKDKYNIDIKLTECGYDQYIFFPKNAYLDISEQLTINALLPQVYNRPYEKIYDFKRKTLLSRVEHFAKENNIIFKCPNELSTQGEMNSFYQNGDIFICLSHSEGNPLGGFEAGGCGNVGISTTVGAMNDFIMNNETGYLIDNMLSDDEIYEKVCEKILYLNENRSILRKMKQKMYENAINNWTWEKKIDQWDNFFST